jgi:glycosyltransferase involved in cell wall biosynthesis
VRVCVLYDHVYPATAGGGEKWLHDVAAAVAAAGHDVTYVTMRHWEADGQPPAIPGVRVVGIAPAGAVYRDERRRFGPPLRFGLAVARHLARHGREYDVVHTAAFPYFPLIAAWALRRRGGYRLVVDWFEAWTARYWRGYAGAIGGTIGWAVQRASVALPQTALCNSEHTAARLRAEGGRMEIVVVPGLYAGPTDPSPHARVEPLVVFAGRHVKEKRVPALVRAFAAARAHLPDLRLELFGAGPEVEDVRRTVRELDLEEAVDQRGIRSREEVDDAFARAACVATASEREGYGLVVIEAAARGTPSVVVRGPENAATDLVVDGINGVVAESADPHVLGRAIVRAVEGGDAFRASTTRWFEQHAVTARFDRSVEVVLTAYGVPPGGRS